MRGIDHGPGINTPNILKKVSIKSNRQIREGGSSKGALSDNRTIRRNTDQSTNTNINISTTDSTVT